MNITIDCKAKSKTFYHGTSSSCNIKSMLLPPNVSSNLSEQGRLKNLDRVFFTEDVRSAAIYAGRACRVFGGKPVIYRVIPMGNIVCLNSIPGTTVYHSTWCFVEEIEA